MVIFSETGVAFDWEIRISDFASECLRVDFNQDIQIRILWISFFIVRLGNPQKDLQNYSRKQRSSFC